MQMADFDFIGGSAEPWEEKAPHSRQINAMKE